MPKVEQFGDLDVWQRAHGLAGKTCAVVRHGEFARDHGFRDQICRAAVSRDSNIAEGFGRRPNGQFQPLFPDIPAIGKIPTSLTAASTHPPPSLHPTPPTTQPSNH